MLKVRQDPKDKVNPNEAKYEVLDNNEPTEKKGEENPMKVDRSEVGRMKSADTIDEVKRTEDEVTEETTKKHDDTIDRTTATDDSLEGMTATGDRQGTGKAVALKARGLEKSIKLKQKSNNQTKRAPDRVLDSVEDDRMEMNSNDSDEAHSCIGSITDGDSVGGRISAGLNNISKNQKVQEKAGTNQINRPKKADNKAGELDFANALKELKALREKEKPNSGEQSAVLQHDVYVLWDVKVMWKRYLYYSMGFVSNKESEEKKGKERKPGMAAINKVNLPMQRNTDEKNKKVKEKVQKKVVNPPHECPKSESIINQEKSEKSRPLIP
ncbi:unnamed protein product [Angiostrongylus costaricensis]|uniref:Uncharacterized protein n=1 Tax=Angiostrongylus costaricensis TaxID=334426 RepID=A0A0R3PWA0_ANGCS|nr:unnamed protein product [Angiostrongylus costaricensis]